MDVHRKRGLLAFTSPFFIWNNKKGVKSPRIYCIVNKKGKPRELVEFSSFLFLVIFLMGKLFYAFWNKNKVHILCFICSLKSCLIIAIFTSILGNEKGIKTIWWNVVTCVLKKGGKPVLILCSQQSFYYHIRIHTMFSSLQIVSASYKTDHKYSNVSNVLPYIIYWWMK